MLPALSCVVNGDMLTPRDSSLRAVALGGGAHYLDHSNVFWVSSRSQPTKQVCQRNGTLTVASRARVKRVCVCVCVCVCVSHSTQDTDKPGNTNPQMRRRKDGALGGLVVEKCKFLQESGCKGLCLNQCKLPAQQFFSDALGLALTVSPNFETQECQWSFGETALPPEEDPDFPKGCLAGCPTRDAVKEAKQAMTCM